MSEIPWKIRDFNFSSLGPLILGALILFWLSCLSEWPNQLAYITLISGFGHKFSESVKTLKICTLEPKLWPPEVGVSPKRGLGWCWLKFI